ncbi:MAG TPA: CHAT domain-containing tetratricopeptide repeat protein [Allosphingosinicella sp.]|nr:CHAT domain-containing tetratricopeptide repeat protein [Allosphingosinicella sp.]
MGLDRVAAAFAAALLMSIAVPALAQPLAQPPASPPIAAADKARLDAMRKAADDLDEGADPAAYRKAWEQVLAFGRTLYPAGHPELAALESELVTADYLQGDIKGALARSQRIAAALEAAGPAYHDQLVDISNGEVVILMTLSRHDEARRLAARVLEWRLAASQSKPSTNVAAAYSNLANAEFEFGNYDKAIGLVRQAIAEDRRLDPIPPNAAPHFANLPVYLLAAGRLEEATEEARAAQALFEKVLPPNHPFQASNLNTLARILIQLGRPAEAENVARKATDLAVARFGRSQQAVSYMTILAQALTLQGKTDEAQAIAKGAADILTQAIGPDADRTLAARESYAAALAAAGDRQQAMVLLKAVAAARAAKLPPFHRDRILGGDRMAVTALKLGDLAAARTAQADAQALRRATLPPEDIGTLAGEARLGAIEARAGDPAGGWRRARAAAAALDARVREIAASGSRRTARDTDIRDAYGWALDAAVGAGDREAAFRLAQKMMESEAGRAAQAAAARARANDPKTADLLRARQDSALALEALLDRQLRLAGRGADPATIQAVDAERKATAARLAEQTEAIRARAPYILAAEIVEPLDFLDTQMSLRSNEALLVAAVGETRTALFAVTTRGIVMASSEGGAERVNGLVRRLRAGLTPEAAARGVPFDFAASAALHAMLLPPRIRAAIAGRRLLVSANSGLAALPFALLAPAARRPSLRNAHWLIRDHAIVTLPSVAGIRMARRDGERKRVDAFVAIGAPKLAPAAPGGALAFRSANLARQVRDLPALPGAEPELRALGGALAARRQTILTGGHATEAAIRGADLAHADVLAFATHGVTAGQLEGLEEPALVVTPDGADDGLLTASEIMRLRLDADWVLLSACDTAAGSANDETGLAGLARAFLYAGGRNLLASHWAVRDDAAAYLSVETVKGYGNGADPAEALRRAMLRMIDGHPIPGSSQPINWAPFVFVGR